MIGSNDKRCEYMKNNGRAGHTQTNEFVLSFPELPYLYFVNK